MESDIKIQIILLLVLLFLSGFFSSAETALVSCNKIRMRTLADQGHKRAKMVLDITEDQGKMLSAILIGNNLVNTFSASIAATIAYSFGGAAVSIATFLITILILIFGEITPKTLATQKKDEMALAYVPIIRFLMIVLTPIIFLINSICSILLRCLGIEKDKNNPSMTTSELRTIVDVSHEEGVIEKDEKELINNVFDFGDVKAKDVMVPRVHVVMAEVDSTYEDLLNLFREEMFTRIPIYKDSIDNVIGLVNMKDLLLYKDLEHFEIHKILRKAFYTYENKPISDLLLEMRKSTVNLSIVLDEYGGMTGICTLHDIMESLVGEIYEEDELDRKEIQRIDSNQWRIYGSAEIEDVEQALGISLHDDDENETFNGYILSQYGRIPENGSQFEIRTKDLLITVKEVKNHRIEQTIVQLSNDY